MSEKSKDCHGRYRSRTIGFRVSPEENRQIDIAVALSGLTKQEYIVSKLLDRTIVVKGNSRIHRAVYDALIMLLEELKRINTKDEINKELMDNISLVAGLVSSLYGS